MTLDDLKKLATGSLLFSLDRIIAPRMVNILYLLGLAGIVLWAISHFFATFSLGFGNGLWGLLEIVVFGLLGFVGLRTISEAIIVYFKTHEKAAQDVSEPRPSMSLIDEVRDAIEELADADNIDNVVAEKPKAVAAKPAAKKPRRTARRTPKSSS